MAAPRAKVFEYAVEVDRASRLSIPGGAQIDRLDGWTADHLLLAGPGRLCQGFVITREHDGTDLVDGRHVRIERGRPVGGADVVAGPRVGLTVAREHPWRFTIRGSRFVSRGPVRLPEPQDPR